MNTGKAEETTGGLIPDFEAILKKEGMPPELEEDPNMLMCGDLAGADCDCAEAFLAGNFSPLLAEHGLDIDDLYLAASRDPGGFISWVRENSSPPQ